MNLRCILGFHRMKVIMEHRDGYHLATQGCLRCQRWWYKTLIVDAQREM